MRETWVGDQASIPGLGRSPGEGKGYPLQYFGIENSMDSPWGHKRSDTTERLSLSQLITLLLKSLILAHRHQKSLFLEELCKSFSISGFQIGYVIGFLLVILTFRLLSLEQKRKHVFIKKENNVLF